MQRIERYYKFSDYLKKRFGCRVYKVSIDAGFSCPNKDGRLSTGGCIYCDNKAFSFNTRTSPGPVEEQIKAGIESGRRRTGAKKFIVYFQAYTNTYDRPEILKERYDCIKRFKDVVGVSIGTRPDFVDDDILDVIGGYSTDYEVWMEYGLGTMRDKTLGAINRNHLYKDFLKAFELTRKRNIKICAHIIIGLPGETRDDIMDTAREMGRLKVDGVKIHPLHVVKGTKLEELFRAGSYEPLALDEYASLSAEFLKYISPDTVIQRMTADCPEEMLVSPLWILDKNEVLKNIGKRLLRDDSYQGMFFGVPKEPKAAAG